MRTAGIVLAAGASQRMGRPKALLCGPDGVPLAAQQAEVLRRGGCNWVAVVVGSEADRVRSGLPGGLATVENPRWAQGRATSLQTGAGAFPEADGVLFLPVDAVGVKPTTIRALLAAAETNPSHVWRPVHNGVTGHVLWVPRVWVAELQRLPEDARVDEWAKPLAQELDVDDPAILRNVNTPQDWEELTKESADGAAT